MRYAEKTTLIVYTETQSEYYHAFNLACELRLHDGDISHLLLSDSDVRNFAEQIIGDDDIDLDQYDVIEVK